MNAPDKTMLRKIADSGTAHNTIGDLAVRLLAKEILTLRDAGDDLAFNVALDHEADGKHPGIFVECGFTSCLAARHWWEARR